MLEPSRSLSQKFLVNSLVTQELAIMGHIAHTLSGFYTGRIKLCCSYITEPENHHRIVDTFWLHQGQLTISVWSKANPPLPSAITVTFHLGKIDLKWAEKQSIFTCYSPVVAANCDMYIWGMQKVSGGHKNAARGLGKDRVHEENKHIGQKIWNLVLLTISSLVRVPVLSNQQASTCYTKCSCKPTHHPQIPIVFYLDELCIYNSGE